MKVACITQHFHLSLCRACKGTQQIQQKAQIAQLVEQLAFNQLVLGSSPSLRTIFLNVLSITDKAFLGLCSHRK